MSILWYAGKVECLVCGSRRYWNMQNVWDVLDWLLYDDLGKENSTIIQGGAEGPDRHAKVWAEENYVNNIEVRPIKPEPIYYLYRNAEMIGMSNLVLCFWDGKSRGTRFVIEYAKHRKKEGFVIYDKPFDKSKHIQTQVYDLKDVIL